ncbi:MOSC N-terminal beta barrel domain-containing protein [Streptomyces sp. NPDC002911]
MLSPVPGAACIHPVTSLGALASYEGAVEPWGLAGDRRRMLIDSGSRVVTQRQQPRMAQLSAGLLSGGGLVPAAAPQRLCLVGRAQLAGGAGRSSAAGNGSCSGRSPSVS